MYHQYHTSLYLVDDVLIVRNIQIKINLVLCFIVKRIPGVSQDQIIIFVLLVKYLF